MLTLTAPYLDVSHRSANILLVNGTVKCSLREVRAFSYRRFMPILSGTKTHGLIDISYILWFNFCVVITFLPIHLCNCSQRL
jgi:hypothetical protein